MSKTTKYVWPRLLAVTAMIVMSQFFGLSAAHADVGLELSKSTGLDPAGESIQVKGQGFQPNITLFLVACDPAVPKGGACDMANFKQVKTDAQGGFAGELKVVASFGSTDCLKTPCAIQTSKVGGGADRSQEAFAAIGFTGGVAPAATATPSEQASPDSSKAPVTEKDSADSDSSSTPWLIGGGVLVVVALGAVLALRRRSAA